MKPIKMTGVKIMASMQDYQELANNAAYKLESNQDWKARYSEYASKIINHLDDLIAARKTFHQHPPLHIYVVLGRAMEGSLEFNLRYLGQSVGDVKVEKDEPLLLVTDDQKGSNKKRFNINEEVYSNWKKTNSTYSTPWRSDGAKQFRNAFKAANKNLNLQPTIKEHMYESLLYTELEKKVACEKTLKHIQPIFFGGKDSTRVHMKTALSASKAKDGIIEISETGGEIDLFCRTRYGNTARLNVIEIKDKNESDETFHIAIKQAIAYAVFIRALINSESGEKWIKLWGMENQNWQNGFTINAVVAMPKGNADDLSFAGQTIALGKDKIELHYIAFTSTVDPSSTGLSFETSLNQKENI